MNWLFLSVAALGIVAVALRRFKPNLEELLRSLTKSDAPEPTLRKITPLDRLIDALKQEQDPLERHRLLSRIVEEGYRQRSDPAIAKLFMRFAGMQVQELPQMAEALKAAHDGKLPDVPAFKLLAAALEEDGRHDEAASIRQQAVEVGLIDGVEPTPAGRIRKSTKKIKSAQSPAKRPARRSAPVRGK
jgi:hypothetical protein